MLEGFGDPCMNESIIVSWPCAFMSLRVAARARRWWSGSVQLQRFTEGCVFAPCTDFVRVKRFWYGEARGCKGVRPCVKVRSILVEWAAGGWVSIPTAARSIIHGRAMFSFTSWRASRTFMEPSKHHLGQVWTFIFSCFNACGLRI